MLFKDRWKACAALMLSAGLLITSFSGCGNIAADLSGAGEDPRGSIQAGIQSPTDPDDHPGQSVIPGRHSAGSETTQLGHDPEEGNEDPVSPDPADDPINEDPPAEDPPAENPPAEDPPQIKPAVYGELPEGPRVDDSYFDDAVFIGDSVTLMLQYYVMKQRAEDPDFLGKATFLTAGSFSYRHAVTAVTESSIHPVYNGTKMLVEDSIAQIGAKKIYIMLGMNDIANKNYSLTMDNVDTLVSRILVKNPDAKFYFESVTPRMANSEHSYLNNEIIRGFNDLLAQYCADYGHYFVNIYAGICDEDGALPAAYCSDPVSEGGNGMGIHFTYAGCAVWVDYLYTHTA